MTRFSDRYGYTSVRDVMQLEGMDEQLKNGLWSVFYEIVAVHGEHPSYSWVFEDSEYYYLLNALWKKFYKHPVDTIPLGSYSTSLQFVRDRFYNTSWFYVYNSLEFVAQNISYNLSLKPLFYREL